MNYDEAVAAVLRRVDELTDGNIEQEVEFRANLDTITAEVERLRMTQGGMEFTARLDRAEAALREIAGGDEVSPGVHVNIAVGSDELRRIARAALAPNPTEEPEHG